MKNKTLPTGIADNIKHIKSNHTILYIYTHIMKPAKSELKINQNPPQIDVTDLWFHIL